MLLFNISNEEPKVKYKMALPFPVGQIVGLSALGAQDGGHPAPFSRPKGPGGPAPASKDRLLTTQEIHPIYRPGEPPRGPCQTGPGVIP